MVNGLIKLNIMNKLEMYMMALKSQLDKIEDKDTLVYQTLQACYDLATAINKL
jgi:hypothetical protein